jgi:imidazolonepropionase-like amidohydrolase
MKLGVILRGQIYYLFILLSLVAQLWAQQASSNAQPIVLKNATVIDVKSGKLLPATTVIVSGNRIAAIGMSKKVRIPPNATVIDATGKYLIPGLWDMHAHALTDSRYEWAFPMLIANGVTGIREMGSNLAPEKINQVRRDVADGKILGPRFGALTYQILDGAGTQLITATPVRNPDEARQFVRDYKRLGADFIKPYNLLSRETYLAMVDEARRQKIPLEGHVPFSVTAEEASDLGQITIEHNFGVLFSTSRNKEELLKSVRDEPNRWPLFESKAAATFDEQKAKALFQRLVRNGTWSCPTIIVYRQIIHFNDEKFFLNNPGMKYVPAQLKERWHTQFETVRQINLNAENEKRWEMRSRLVPMMHEAGIRLIAGTDMGALYVLPGFSLHDELQLMVEAGLSPLEVLQSATISPAKFLGKEKDFGTIEKGKIADLVLLDANPLENITNSKRISAVVLNGHYLPHEALEKLLEDAETSAKK